MEATSAPRPLAARLPVPRRVLAAFSDERLVDHVRRGDTAAFEVLYDRHSAGILAFCRHMLGSAADAEDAVQHSFIAAHNDLQRHSERDLHFKAWLYTIARNRCLSMLRARREQSTDEIEIVSDRMSDELQQRADLRALLLDVHKLPDDQREALVLSEIGDLSHADVAEVLGCEAAKVKSLVFQARSSLLDRRLARETPCEEIREQIATLRGGALRRSHLRHHLEACPGCSEYREQVRRQRAMLAVALPVIPSAGLRGDVLAAVGIGGGTATAATGAGVGGLAIAAKGGLAKAGIVAMLAGGTAGGVTVANNGTVPFLGSDSTPASQSSTSGAADSGAPGGGTTGAATTASEDEKDDARESGPENRSESGKEHGFTPTRGESNGERAREFARTRGKGKKKGLAKERRAQRRKAKRQKRAKARLAPRARARTETQPKQQSQTPTRTAPTPKPTTTTPEPAPAPEVEEPEPEPVPVPTTTTPAPAPVPDSDPAAKGGGGGAKKLVGAG